MKMTGIDTREVLLVVEGRPEAQHLGSLTSKTGILD